MLAIQSNIARNHCLYTQGAVTFQTPGAFFDKPGRIRLITCQFILRTGTLDSFGVSYLDCGASVNSLRGVSLKLSDQGSRNRVNVKTV